MKGSNDAPGWAELERRRFLKGLLGTAAGAALPAWGCREDLVPASPGPEPGGWDAGDLVHLLPTASHERLLLKASFRRAFERPPLLVAGERRVSGEQTDSRGRFFTFDLKELAADTRHTLVLQDASGRDLCDPWPLRTLPASGTRPERLRLLVYTCAGGPESLYNFGFFDAFVPLAQRRRMLRRALAFEPDAVIANGDHVYWDLLSSPGRWFGRSLRARAVAGHFDRERAIVGTPNEDVLLRAFGPQLAGLYGVMFRSHPTYFLQDDHDYGENDEASDALRTFPPDPFMLDLARTTQRLYYPELLAGPALPAAHVAADGRAESYGSFRWGDLFEALLYDCRRHLSNTADPARADTRSGFVPPDVEAWLLARTRGSPCAHVAHMPSTPVLWSAGKWGEWYPDFQDVSGVLRAHARKPYWAEGWAAQHDRLLAAAAGRRDRTPLFVSGDLHALAAGRILASGELSFRDNPVVSLLVGAPGTGALGWPSKFRGQLPVPSGTLRAEEMLAPLEENGFSLLDVTPDAVTVSQFRWLPERGEAALDRLEPFSVLRFPRPGSA